MEGEPASWKSQLHRGALDPEQTLGRGELQDTQEVGRS